MTLSDFDLLEAIIDRQAQDDFLTFRRRINPKAKIGWFFFDITARLQQFYNDLVAGQRPKLIIQAPPQHGKSEAVTDFVCWLAGKDPELRSIYASFSERLGVRANLKVQRTLATPRYQRIFPNTALNSKNITTVSGQSLRNKEILEYVGHGGYFRNTTVQGSITGEGLDCLVAGTKIITNIGVIAIEDLENLCYDVKILTHGKEGLSYENLQAFSRSNSAGIYRVTDSSGRFFEASANHRVFTENRGYIEASFLSVGDIVLCSVPSAIREESLRCGKVDQCGRIFNVLFKKMLFKAYCGIKKDSKQVRGMWQRHPYKMGEILFRLFRKKEIETRREIPANKKRLSSMQKFISIGAQRKWKVCSVLFSGLFKCCSLKKNVRRRKPDVETWMHPTQGAATFCESISTRTPKSFRERWTQMFSVFSGRKETRSPSYRRMANEQLLKQFNNTMHKMSFGDSPTNEVQYETIRDEIVSIERVSEQAITYDIQVEKNSNFFANGILVHNCGIIDDPIKGREAANSATMRQKAWDWFTDDFFTRFSEDAGLLMILTRWHVDDPAGRMIEAFGDKIIVVKYEAIATRDEEHRNEGEPLFPELKSLDFLMERKNTMPRGNYEALYQQSPIVQDGEILKLEWFKWWEVLPRFSETSIFVDTAQKKGERNDFTVAQLWGNYDGNVYLLDMIRIKENAPEAQKMIEVFYFKHESRDDFKRMYIEDKSSGSSMLQVFKSKRMKVGAIQRNVDKEQRANIFGGYIEMGRAYLNSQVPNITYLTDEAVSFPNGVHDDTIDPMLDAIEKYCVGSSKSSLWERMI